jgi:bacillithiol biosynthesis cysteine-adding enzyme BshC
VSLEFVATPLPGTASAEALEQARRGQSARPLAADLAPAFAASGAAGANLDALLSGRALAVTTGQQAGLFTGPLYTIHKALTAAALAERLTEVWHRPVVPVFWVAGDDHDFAEIASCDVLAQDGHRETVRLRERPADAPMRPAFRELLGADVVPALERLEALLPASEFRPALMDWLRRAYAPDRSLAEAHALAVAELLGEYGVLVLRGWHGAVKRAASGVFRGALARAGELDAALSLESERLKRDGHDAGVEVGHGLSLVMVEGAQGRDRLRAEENGGFATRRSHEHFDLSSLEALLRDDPETMSANVLLRPVVEAAVLPTVAYVGGPAELAYLALLGPLFATFGVPRPARIPRLSGLLLDERTAKTLGKFGLEPLALARPEADLVRDAARDALPEDAVAALEALRASLTDGYAALQREVALVDRTLERPVESARNQALAATHDVEKRLLAAQKRSSETSIQQLVKARAALFPDGRPQERVYTVATFLARFGGDVLPALAAAARARAGQLLEASRHGT